MKKYFPVLLGILLLGGIATAQEDILVDVGFEVVDGDKLPQNEDDAYVLITDGNSENVYQIAFSPETSPISGPEEAMAIGLCLQNSDFALPTLEPYYANRDMPTDYRDYLLSAAAGESPFAIVQIEPGDESLGTSPVVKLCDGAVYNLTLERDCLPMRIPGDYPCGKYTVSNCDGNPPLTFELIICTDSDRDEINDYEDKCLNSDLTGDLDGTVVIDKCDSGVDNILFEDGCTISDLIMRCADGAGNHGEFVSCVAHLTNELKSTGLLSGAQKGAIQSCAAQSNIGGLPCESCDDDTSGLGQNPHRARYELSENDLVMPCVEIGDGQYISVDMNLTSASSKNFHFKVKKADRITQVGIQEIDNLEGTCAHYDLGTNSLIFPSLDIAGTLYQVQMKLLGANSANLHFKLQAITEVGVE